MDTLVSRAVGKDELVHRNSRLLKIIENGLPPFQHTVLELLEILNDPNADFKKAAKPIYMDPTLSAQVLRMCNSPLFGRRSRVITIEQAVSLLGSDRLRSMAMTSTLVGFVGQGLPQDQINAFWKHSFFCGMLAKHLARLTGYTEVEQAYIAGLLHDIGQVPQWILIAEEKAKHGSDLLEISFDNPGMEQSSLGITHCKLGERMATNWGLMPSFVDVILNHHSPADAQHDPYLVDLVSRVEEFLLAKELLDRHSSATESAISSNDHPQALHGELDPNLTEEYEHLLPLVETSLATMIGSVS
jgi:putative nucleotidyltransferase with HDIG domain